MNGQESHLTLQSSEASVLAVASRILAAYIVAGHTSTGAEDHLIDQAIDIAVKMAGRFDKKVVSDEELGGGKEGSGFSGLQAPQVFQPPGR